MTLPPRTPDDVIDIANGFFAARALIAGARTGVFGAIAGGTRTVEEIAETVGLDARAADLLLHALAAMGLLERRPGPEFALTPVAEECLGPDAPRDITDYLELDADTFEAWSRIEEALASGRPIEISSRAAAEGPELMRKQERVGRWARRDGARRHASFIRAMRSSARGNAPLVAARLDLQAMIGRAPRSLLDLGGGPGTYAVEFCRAHTDLRATVYDLPETVAIARGLVLEDGPALAGRIDFRAGDFHADALGGPYDVVWLSHVIHGHPEATLPALLARAAAALAPGGALVVHDFILDETHTRPRFGALFALNMLVMSDRGRTYSFAEVRALLERAGLGRVEPRDFGEPRGISIVLARRAERE